MSIPQIYATYSGFVNAAYPSLFQGEYAVGMGTNASKHTAAEKKALGKRLAAARKLAGFDNQEPAAAEMRLAKATLSAWETGRNLPDALMVRRLAHAYGVTPDALLWDDALSLEAIRFGAEYDKLNESQQRTFRAVWAAYVRQSNEGEPDSGDTGPMPLAPPPSNPKRPPNPKHR